MDTNAHPAVLALHAVLKDAADTPRIPGAELAVELLEAREWPDSCLGLPAPDEACMDVVTPGFLVVLGEGFVYRTDQQGNVRRDTSTIDRELAVYFRQVGGIGGFASEYYADDTSLSHQEAEHVRQFIDDAGFFDLPVEVGNGQPIADGYSYTVFLAHGRRNHRVHTYMGNGPHESPALEQFIGWLIERAPAPHPRPVPIAR